MIKKKINRSVSSDSQFPRGELHIDSSFIDKYVIKTIISWPQGLWGS